MCFYAKAMPLFFISSYYTLGDGAQLHAAVHGGALKETVRFVLAHFEPGDKQQLCAVNEPRVI